MAKEDVIYLSNVRLSFPHIAEPQRQRNEQTGIESIRYAANFILPPAPPAFQEFMKGSGAAMTEKWKEHAAQVMSLIQNDRRLRCFGRGEEKINNKTYTPYDGYAGQLYLSASRDKPPQVIQADGVAVDPANTMAYQQITRKLYGGCRVNAAIKPWLQDNKHGRGIRADFVAIQFAADDTPFGEGEIDASEIFGAVEAPANGGPSPAGVSFPGFGAPAAPAPAMP